jgi:hypothetical protein
MKSVVVLVNGQPIIMKAKHNAIFSTKTWPAPDGWSAQDSKFVSFGDDGAVIFDHDAREREQSTVAERIKKGFFRG